MTLARRPSNENGRTSQASSQAAIANPRCMGEASVFAGPIYRSDDQLLNIPVVQFSGSKITIVEFEGFGIEICSQFDNGGVSEGAKALNDPVGESPCTAKEIYHPNAAPISAQYRMRDSAAKDRSVPCVYV